MALNLQLDGEARSAVLVDLALALGPAGLPVRLCLIRSAACFFGGMEGPTSADLDIIAGFKASGRERTMANLVYLAKHYESFSIGRLYV